MKKFLSIIALSAAVVCMPSCKKVDSESALKSMEDTRWVSIFNTVPGPDVNTVPKTVQVFVDCFAGNTLECTVHQDYLESRTEEGIWRYNNPDLYLLVFGESRGIMAEDGMSFRVDSGKYQGRTFRRLFPTGRKLTGTGWSGTAMLGIDACDIIIKFISDTYFTVSVPGMDKFTMTGKYSYNDPVFSCSATSGSVSMKMVGVLEQDFNTFSCSSWGTTVEFQRISNQ